MSDGLWPFVLAFYAKPGVAPACLRCQDEAGADVNIILFLLWQARDGVRLSTADIAVLDATVTTWRNDVVHPLRAARRRLKEIGTSDAAELRIAVKAVELEAERLELELLAKHARPGSDHPAWAAAAANLAAYDGLPADAIATLLGAFNRA